MYKPEQVGVKTIQAFPIDFSQYDELQRAGWKLIRSFSDRARAKADCKPWDSFEPFIFGWIALNSWASCVTGSEGDKEQLNALMLDRELNARFGSLRQETEFQ